MTRDFVRVYWVAAGAGFSATGSTVVILAMRSIRLLLTSFILTTLLIACSIAVSTSSSHSYSNSSSSKIFSSPLREGITFGGSVSFSSLLADSSTFSSFSPLLFPLLLVFHLQALLLLLLFLLRLPFSLSMFTPFCCSNFLCLPKIKLLQQRIQKVCISTLHLQGKLMFLCFKML